MSTDDAKTYLSKREIPRLFESLMTGLMYHRPSDHIGYLIECLNKVKDKGQKDLAWNSFVEVKRTKTPLPPITPDNGKRPKSRSKTPQKIESERSLTPIDRKTESPIPIEEKRGTPLPPIEDKSEKTTAEVAKSVQPVAKGKADIPDVPIIFIMGGPGSGKLTQVNGLLKNAPGWVHLSMGDILRSEIAKKGDADDKWSMIGDLVSKGEMAPQEVTDELLVDSFKQHKDAKGFILEGYPRQLNQVTEYMNVIGTLNAVIYIDCDEHYCTQRLLQRGKKQDRIDDNLGAISKRLSFYKENTLPVVKYFDDCGLAFILDGDRDRMEVEYDILNIFNHLKKNNFVVKDAKQLPVPKIDNLKPKTDVNKPTQKPPTNEKKVEPPPLVNPPPVITVPDTGRKEGLPKCPVIFVAGGPGSGKGTQCKRMVERYKGTVHLSMGDILRNQIAQEGTADEKWGMIGALVQKGEMAPQEITAQLLVEEMKKNKDATAFFIEGFPRSKEQVEDFNQCIGGLNFIILLDCEEYYLQHRLIDRGQASGRIDDNLNAIQNRINFFRNNTLPILKGYDDQGKLVPMNGDRDADEIFYDISRCLDMAFYGKQPNAPGADEKPVNEEVIAPETATTTGDNVENPSHSKTLDKADGSG